MTDASALMRMPLWSVGRRTWSWWIGELRGLLPIRIRGERRRRIDATIDLGREHWLLRDRRGVETTIDPLDGPAMVSALEALKGRRKQAKVAVVVPLSRCFVRRTELPRAMLGHAASILQSELDVATPFHGGSVHWDWLADGPGTTAGTVAITQVILKRRDTVALIDSMGNAGIVLTRLTVKDDSSRAAKPLPLNLLRGETGAGADITNLRNARRILIAAAVVAALAIGPTAFLHQSATLAALDDRLAEVKDAVALRPGLPRAPLEALGESLATKRTMPPVDTVLDRLAATLPADCTLEHLYLDGDVLTIQGSAASVHALERALAASPMFSAGHNTAPPNPDADRAPFTIRLKLKPASPAPDA